LGIKAPLTPILLLAYLQTVPDEIAVYQDGTFQPRITPDLLERLTKAPARFSIRHISVQGQRAAVLRALARRFDLVVRSSATRNAAPLLSIVAPLLETVRQQPEYALHAAMLSPETTAVRGALLSAREPDRLLFAELPSALGLDEFGPNSGPDPEEYAAKLHSAMVELTSAYAALLRTIGKEVSEGLVVHAGNSLKAEAAARARPLLGQVADARLRALLFALSSDSLDDDDWLEAVGLSITERPPKMWRAEDVERFPGTARALLGAFRRVEALHFELRAAPQEGFVARRVTVTSPDGVESGRVVWIDKADRDWIRSVVSRFRGEVLSRGADAAEDLLLAALAEQLLPINSGEQPERADHRQAREEKTASG
jgi:hypothetical protein